MIGPTLETERLLLRPLLAEDFDAYADFMADPACAQFVGGVQPRSAAWRGMAQLVGSWTLRGFSMFAMIERSTGQWLGRTGPWYPEGWPGPEVGWGVIASAQRKGYAREAALASIDWAFEMLGWEQVVHCIDPLNAPSIGLARKLGSEVIVRGFEAPAPLQGVRWDVYGQTRAQWRARHARGSLGWRVVGPSALGD